MRIQDNSQQNVLRLLGYETPKVDHSTNCRLFPAREFGEK
jgi:hypothetical protein